MLNPNYIILYVENPRASADFYSHLLGRQPIESSPTFILFALENGLRFGLWLKHDVEPAVAFNIDSSSELAILVINPEMVLNLYQHWKTEGVKIIQEPKQMDFGLNFVAIDLDGHRLRVFARSSRLSEKKTSAKGYANPTLSKDHPKRSKNTKQSPSIRTDFGNSYRTW